MTPRRRSLFVLLLWCLCGPALARDIADMTGQTVNLPDRPLRAFASIPPLTSFLEVVAPDVVVALNRPLTDGERPYLSPGLSTLPVAGGWFGNGAGANLELLASLRPDVIVMEAENPVAGDI
ncbi:MAG TPA: hypothetical protein VN809_09720, partial [Telmatospirillum sp.]|nr:hypothetical protein [Telmatospirillum sp.]